MHDNNLWKKVIFPEFMPGYKVLLMKQEDLNDFNRSAEEAFSGSIPSSLESLTNLIKNSPKNIYDPEEYPEAPLFCFKIVKMNINESIGFAIISGNQYDCSCEIILYFISPKYWSVSSGKLSAKLTRFMINYIQECGFEYCATYVYNKREALIKLLVSCGFKERAVLPEFMRVGTPEGHNRVDVVFLDKILKGEVATMAGISNNKNLDVLKNGGKLKEEPVQKSQEVYDKVKSEQEKEVNIKESEEVKV